LSPAQQQALEQLEVRIADLPGPVLGQALGSTITIDVNAAGWGWHVEKDENGLAPSGSPLSALDARPRMDLLTAVMHELGHVLGYDDDYSASDSDDLMNGWLEAGDRRALTHDERDRLFADTDRFLEP
jgi:hypothetical protein